MEQFPHTCGMMQGDMQVALCEPLAQLKREHTPLRQQMNDFAALAGNIGYDPQFSDWSERLSALKAKVDAFIQVLDPHSEIEEEGLFPLMAKYIGREVGPIAVMEYEHEQAKKHLSTFVEMLEAESAPIPAERAREIAAHALQAHSILTDHFTKEEVVLFPMAERILSDADKAELKQQMKISN